VRWESVRILHRIVGLVTETRLAVVVMGLIAVLSLAGAVIPQKRELAFYAGAYGEPCARVVSRLGLTDVFGADYFTVLLVALCLMVFACALKGLALRMRAAGEARTVPDGEALRAMSCSAAVDVGVDAEEARMHVADILRRRLYRVRVGPGGAEAGGEGGLTVVGSKMGFARYGTFVLHLSFIFLLAGGVALSRFGHHDYRKVAVGKTFTLQVASEKTVDVAVEDFDIEFDEGNRVSDYVCKVAVRDGGEVLARRTVSPNHPLKYRGREIYLNSFAEDENTLDGVVLAVVDSTGAVVVEHLGLADGERAYVDQMQGTITADLAGAPRVLVAFDGGRLESHMVRGHPTEASDGPSGYRFILLRPIYALVITLEVVREPGQWLLIVGFILLTAGVFSALYLSPRLVWARVKPAAAGRAQVLLAGRSTRARDHFAREFAAIRRALEELA
jgi:cytochrome c biogenesis protein